MGALLYVFAVAAGILNNVQTGANATLQKTLGQPVLAALVVAATNCITYLAVAPFVGLAWPGADKVASVPWWAWTGGVLGGVYVLAMLFVAGPLGAASFTGVTVTAAIVTSLVLDQFGWVGFAVHPAGAGRLLGGALMVIGTVLVCVF